ncbi:MAG TPA: NRDE family protein, partial [Woeseiaceae bacterium]|nr:NRDE family protein [Woeseiaceae bacterium]
MCLIVAAWQMHPELPLVLAGNRDEFHARPTAPADWWPDEPDLLAGRDLEAGGTWLGISRGGRFGVVTNYREGSPRAGEVSRGLLLTDWLTGAEPADGFAARLAREEQRYAGFNLLFGDPATLRYHTNRQAASRQLEPGLHGVSNALLDTPWPKLVVTRQRLARLIGDGRCEPGAILEILADTAPAGEDGETDPALDTALDTTMGTAMDTAPDPDVRRVLSAP